MSIHVETIRLWCSDEPMPGRRLPFRLAGAEDPPEDDG